MSRHQDGTILVSADEDNNKDNVENSENGNKSVASRHQDVLVMAMMERG